MKKLFAIAIAAAMLLTFSAFAAAPEVFRAEYEGNGRVEIDFRNDVSYQNLSIEVTAANPEGDFFSETTVLPENVTILKIDDDDLTFFIDNIRDETTYNFTINGVREGRSGDFGSITGQFTTPAADAVVITELEADAKDDEIDIEFLGRVDYDKPAVTVTRADGTAVEARIVEREGNGMEVRAKGLVRGEEYTVTVTGVSQQDANQFGSVSRTVIAR